MTIRDPATNPNHQMKQYRDSPKCWACDAPVAPQTDKHRDGLCPHHRRLVAEFWTGRREAA